VLDLRLLLIGATMVSCGAGRPCWHLVLTFFAGFVFSNVADMIFQFKGSLNLDGFVCQNVVMKTIRTSTESVASTPCACDCSKATENQESTAVTTTTRPINSVATDGAAPLTVNAPPIVVKERASDAAAFDNVAATMTAATTVTTTLPAMTGFSQIVATAYKRCLVETKSDQPRNLVDLQEWHKNGMAGTGGLDDMDRKLLSLLYHEASSVFEYGLGESTYIANHVGVERYAGIDSDPVWVGMARDKVSPHFRFYLGDIGPTVAWGYPEGSARLPKQVLDYQLQPLIVEPKPFDVYMVDGRWRLPCMIASFLHASARGGDPAKTIVCIHDCMPLKKASLGRAIYHKADDLLEMVNHSKNRLCVYQRKPGTTDEQLRDFWLENLDQIDRRRLLRNLKGASATMTAFDTIVDAAYSRAIVKTKSGTKKVFDIDYWESSGLQTEGGLNRDDRIWLGQIYYDASSVFEYGLGESTLIANHVGVERYAGIDSDPVWVGMARDKVSPHFRFYLGDIGPTVGWGYPADGARLPKQVLDYQLQPLIVEPKPFDVYMVDGRWRLPCMIASFLHASARGGDPAKTIVCIHDCAEDTASRSMADRAVYKRADHLLELVNHSNHRLCLYKRKRTTTDSQLQELWHANMDEMTRRL
jgi:hypothetical protein